jgi:hypothetical protein
MERQFHCLPFFPFSDLLVLYRPAIAGRLEPLHDFLISPIGRVDEIPEPPTSILFGLSEDDAVDLENSFRELHEFETFLAICSSVTTRTNSCIGMTLHSPDAEL